MAILPIIIAPDPRLKVKSEPVARVDPEVVALMDDLLDTMYVAPGIGLAAPQVGVRSGMGTDFDSRVRHGPKLVDRIGGQRPADGHVVRKAVDEYGCDIVQYSPDA